MMFQKQDIIEKNTWRLMSYYVYLIIIETWIRIKC